MLTQQRLKELFHYDPETGLFTRLVTVASNAQKGDIAGTVTLEGYISIGINSKYYMAHRLAFLYMTGKFPENDVDHINSIKNCNIWINLRECNSSQNQQNQKKAQISSKSSGLLGVYYNKSMGKFFSLIGIRGKQTYLGSFKTKEEAHQKYLEAKRNLHEFNTL